jgi:two-component system sensor histidine kinase/response regulator
MIVDDNPVNLKLLEEMLQMESYNVRSFPLGRLALVAAARRPPDLILLDINMPEMNGYEVCERLKSTSELAGIPVIFLSALDKTEDKVKAFACGAADYISKPFQLEEVQARVQTHLNLHNLQRALKQQNRTLEEAVAARTSELAQANAALTILDRSKTEFLSLISHEFRTPLNGLLGVGDIMLEEMNFGEDDHQLRVVFESSRRRILCILEDAQLLTEIDLSKRRFSPQPVALSEVLRNAAAAVREFARSREIRVLSPPDTYGLVIGDEELLVRAMKSLLETSIKFSSKGQPVRIFCEVAAAGSTIIFESLGSCIPHAALGRFFDVFAIGEALTAGGDLGLAPAVAHRVLSLFGASVRVENLNSNGVRFIISLKNAGG